MTDHDTYKLTVIFSRSRSDDLEVCEATQRTYAEQLAAELQEAATAGIVVGSFKVIGETA